jgi:hypothetical protein
MFGLPAVSLAGHQRTGGGLWLGEVVATLAYGLVRLLCPDAGAVAAQFVAEPSPQPLVREPS